jgi:hypothetical protein
MLKPLNSWNNLDLRIDMAKPTSEEYRFFMPLVIADYLDFQNRAHILDMEDPDLELAIRVLSVEGHISNGHLNNALGFLFANYDSLAGQYGVRLPRNVKNANDFLSEIKATFVNTTPYDILSILYNKGLVKKSPVQVMASVQKHIDQYAYFLNDLAEGRVRPFTDANGDPIFGMVRNLDLKFKNQNEVDAYLVATLFGLKVMDSDYWRVMSNLPHLATGINTTLNRRNLVNAPEDDLMHDLKSITQMDIREELPLNPFMTKIEAWEMFHKEFMPKLYNAGIAIPGITKQSKDVTNGYVRIFSDPNGNPGTADFMSNLWAGFMWGDLGFVGLHMADFEDTMEKVALKSYDGGQDTAIANMLMEKRHVSDLFERYVGNAENLIAWSYENPNAEFKKIESCSIRYFLARNTCNGEVFTTIGVQNNFRRHFVSQYETGSVDRNIPSYLIGFGGAPSRQYYDYVLKQARTFYDRGLFPSTSWISSQIEHRTFKY